MAYQINKTDGTVLTTVVDSQIDTASSSITLIGKNYSGFGELLNENFLKILENFSNSSAPEKAVRGQLWYDTSEAKLKIFDGFQFTVVGAAIINAQRPANLNIGDLWYDTTKGQLFFFDGNVIKLIGPDWASAQGRSGLEVSTVFDTTNLSRTIVLLYCSGILLGIFSKDSFTPRTQIDGFTGSIQPGFNVSSAPGVKFNVTATNSERLGTIESSKYVRNDLPINQIEGEIRIESNNGVSVGPNSEISLTTDTSSSFIKVLRTSKENAVVFKPATKEIQFYPDAIVTNPIENQPIDEIRPLYTFNGDLNITGNFNAFEFNAVTLNPIDSTVQDKNIYLAVPEAPTLPSNTIADGGGIILKADNDVKLIWNADTAAWTSTEHINLAENREFKINGVTVLNGNSLGPTITSAPGISNFGVQDIVELGEGDPLTAVMRLEGTRIRAIAVGADLQLQAGPSQGSTPAGNIALFGFPRIVNMGDPVLDQDSTTKKYVDNLVRTKSLIFSIDLSDDKDDNYIINNILNNLAPISENRNGTVARILCSITTILPKQIDINSNLNLSQSIFSKPGNTTGTAITSVTLSPFTINDLSISVVRIIKVFTLINNSWTFVSSNELPL
jgi:hypothetical protein